MLIYDKADKDIEEMFELLLSRYQTGFEESIKGSDIFFMVVLICSFTNVIK